MKQYLLPPTGTFYKVNMHCHTTISDGSFTPEEIKAFYKSKGYSAVVFTDHEVLLGHQDLCDENFIALHGYELAIKEQQNPYRPTGAFMHVHHLNLIAKTQDNLTQPFLYKNNLTPGNCRNYLPQMKYHEEISEFEYSADGLNHIVDTANRYGFLVTYNHPNWSMQSTDLIAQIRHLHAVEVINTGCFYHGDHSGLVYGELCRKGFPVVPVAGDDNHNRQGTLDSCFAFTMIKAPSLSYEVLLQAYEAGDCYASCGPEIHDLYIEDGQVHITTSPVRSILLFSEGRIVLHAPAGLAPFAETEPITHASFPLSEKLGAFFRFELVDFDGRRAFSRAYPTAGLLPEDIL